MLSRVVSHLFPSPSGKDSGPVMQSPFGGPTFGNPSRGGSFELGEKVGEWIRHAFDGMLVQMDGQDVGKIVTNHQAKQADKPPTRPSMFDSRLSRAYPTGFQ